MLRVGLTGGIGAGKSTVARRLSHHGAVVIDSDQLAREVVEPGTEGLRAVVEEFGPQVLTPDGALDRPALAARVFGDDDALSRLNGIVHPLVRARSAMLLDAAAGDAVVVQDIPLLVEGGMAPHFPLVIVVHVDAQHRTRRLVEQRGMAAADARSRIGAQATDSRRRAAADVWLDNSGPVPDTEAAVDQLWRERLVPFEENLRMRRPARRAPGAVLVASDPTWVQQAQRVCARVAAVAGDRAQRVDHIGSTAVPGLEAEDVLDVQMVVADMDAARDVAAELIEAGLVRRDGRWLDNAADGSRLVKAMAMNADPARPVDCHVRPADSPAWREALLFRDWLRAHPDSAREYAAVKHELAERRWDSIDAYADAKSPFIRDALTRAEQWAAEAGWHPSSQ
ncbi:MAG: dephospho-CoA kinase [Pseudonocardiaceae bacterium]|nr:dephospho-CoA kinase [Pseudonocardiaceae bacterium]